MPTMISSMDGKESNYSKAADYVETIVCAGGTKICLETMCKDLKMKESTGRRILCNPMFKLCPRSKYQSNILYDIVIPDEKNILYYMYDINDVLLLKIVMVKILSDSNFWLPLFKLYTAHYKYDATDTDKDGQKISYSRNKLRRKKLIDFYIKILSEMKSNGLELTIPLLKKKLERWLIDVELEMRNYNSKSLRKREGKGKNNDSKRTFGKKRRRISKEFGNIQIDDDGLLLLH